MVQKMKVQSLLALIVVFAVASPCSVVIGDLLPPARLDGFVYSGHRVDPETILVEAFFDPVCPDSRDSWPPLKLALEHYGPRVSFVLHLLPLPYHDNAFVTSRALHIVNMRNPSETFRLLESFSKHQQKSWRIRLLGICSYHDNAFVTSRALHIVNMRNPSETFRLLESFFKHQERFYTAQTHNMSRATVVDEIVKFATETLGNSYYSLLRAGFEDKKTDLATRVSFKYSTSRGVYGTPTFYVNGFVLPDAGSPTDDGGWRKIIDSLLTGHRVKNQKPGTI